MSFYRALTPFGVAQGKSYYETKLYVHILYPLPIDKRVVSPFVPHAGRVAVAGKDGYLVGQGQDFLADALQKLLAVAGGQVAAAYTQLENQIAGENHLVVGAVQTDAAFAVAGRVQHVQMLVAECQGFALLNVAVRGGHILQFETEDRRVGVCAVVFLHSRLVQQDVNTVFFLAPRISRYVVKMWMCIDDVLDIQMVVGHIFTDLSVFVKPAVAWIDNHRLSCLVRQDISVHHQRVEVKRLDFHIHKF